MSGIATPATIADAGVNGCTDCLSAHSYLGRNLAKPAGATFTANRNGASRPYAPSTRAFAWRRHSPHGGHSPASSAGCGCR
jgi:hypothetical protein